MSEEKNYICPLYGRDCVGVDRCAPAVLAAAFANKSMDAETEATIAPVCPIVYIVEGINIVSSALLPLALGTADADRQPSEAVEDKNQADVMRDHVLAGLKIDQ